MKTLRSELKQELVGHILPFWMTLIDQEFGGYYGRVDHNLVIRKDAPKSAIITSRILWSFSTAYNLLKEYKYKMHADHAYHFIIDKFLDKKNGGLYLLTDREGNPIDKRKHINNLSYAIYAFSEYYKVNNHTDVKNIAIDFFELIESKKNTEGYYLEEFDEKWIKKKNVFLDRDNLHAEFTFNTYIHILEAYTSLYSIWQPERLLNLITNLLTVIEEKIFYSAGGTFNEFFDGNWNSLINLKNFGHDIEVSWLLSRTLDIIGFKSQNIMKIIFEICKNVHREALIEGSVILESVNGIKKTIRMWWVQTEAMIGFFNAYQLIEDEKFLEDVFTIWDYIKLYFIDKRESGEWFSSISNDHNPLQEVDIVDSWKGPYHNTRMCIELMQRIGTKNGNKGEN